MMSKDPFKELPLGTLYDLMVNSVKELLEAMELNNESEIAVRAKKKQCELLYHSIMAKKHEGQEVA